MLFKKIKVLIESIIINRQGADMIRKGKQKDISAIMEIWLDTNMEAHNFISPDYWKNNYELVKSMMYEAELYIYEREGNLCGFVGLMGDYIAGIFVGNMYQGMGIGKTLLDYVKKQKEELFLHVYEKNKGAVKFYLREDFLKEREQMEEENQEIEYEMRWRNHEFREKSRI